MLKKLKHPKIVSYYGSRKLGDKIRIFMEYLPGKSVLKEQREFKKFDEKLVQNYTRQILEGLVYLHS